MASASHGSATGSQSSRNRMAAAALVGLGAGALAFWVYRRSRHRNRKSKQRSDGPSLAEEIEAALAQEAHESGVDLEELKADFQAAAAWVADNGGSLSNTVLLSLYGCYKQAMKGDCHSDRPWGMEASMKWDSWHSLAGTSPAEAMRSYVRVLKEAVPAWTPEFRGEADVEPDGKDGGMSGAFGVSVSTMAQVGSDDDVDRTPVGQLNEMIHRGEESDALEVLRKSPELAFQADKDGMTPMHWCADSGSSEVMRALVALLGSDAAMVKSRMNAQDEDGSTPLDYAVLIETEDPGSRLDMARLLAENGADPAAGAEEIPEEWKPFFATS